MLQLFNFRSLASEPDYDNAVYVVNTGKFWCSKFSELNDPMEGVYTIGNSIRSEDMTEKLYGEKCKYKLCFFSGKRALRNPAMWGYYAGGFKGIVISICIEDDAVRKVAYAPQPLHIEAGGVTIERVLTTKLTHWKHEDEYRYLSTEVECGQRIGDIEAIYMGNPYGNACNRSNVYADSESLQRYRCLLNNFLKKSEVSLYIRSTLFQGKCILRIPE